MADLKKGPARVELPARPVEAPPSGRQAGAEEPAEGVTSRILMSRLPAEQRDPWAVPLAGLVLAFSVISLIVQLLIAFS